MKGAYTIYMTVEKIIFYLARCYYDFMEWSFTFEIISPENYIEC